MLMFFIVQKHSITGTCTSFFCSVLLSNWIEVLIMVLSSDVNIY